ncbi:nuclease-related domain-containing protein [Salibacterium aidingense]|uniref:nuclease-related domain-containing protein n=1 Tax=Salibacterium aidingense TaxID=384933 RepID=UPI00040AE903|nr:nuclease-related domain-containing protein [Salibacterium aidingense]
MFLKPRFPSHELLCLRSLTSRTSILAKSRQHYRNLEKGLEGETYYDEWLKTLPEEKTIILCDLLFETNHTHFQIDTLLLTPDTLYLFEVKNYEGDDYRDGDEWYKMAGDEIKNPLLQLKKSESMLRQLFQEHRLHFPMKPYLVFPHPNFFLYYATPDLPIIFASQIKRYLSKWQSRNRPLSKTQRQLAERLKTLVIESSPYTLLPSYTFEQLQKGIFCPTCSSLLQLQDKTLMCQKCS